MPLGLEAFVLGLAEKLGLPGFGPDGFAKGVPLSHFDHVYLKQVANIAIDGKVPDADDEEVKVFLEARKHLPKTVFDPERWKKACGEANWRKVIYVLNRGGRFEDWASAWDGDKVKNKYGTLVNMYVEKTAATKNAMNGKNFYGMATYIPDVLDCSGKPVNDEKDGYDLTLITNKVIQHTKSRTAASPWLMALEPENGFLLNPAAAARLGLKNGDFAYGARDFTIDGKTIKADSSRSTGIHANVAMRVDPVLKNTGLQDVVGGSIVFYGTKVKLVKA